MSAPHPSGTRSSYNEGNGSAAPPPPNHQIQGSPRPSYASQQHPQTPSASPYMAPSTSSPYGVGATGMQSSPYQQNFSYNAPISPSHATRPPASPNQGGLRRRGVDHSSQSYYRNGSTSGTSAGSGGGGGGGSNKVVVQRLDFMFPKVDREFTVQTKGGGVATLAAYGLIAVLLLAELVNWMGQQNALVEHIQVDQSLGKRLQINLNITFPSLACEDLHLDAIDVAGDSQIDIEDTLKKRKLHLDGRALSREEILVETNFHRQQQEQKEALLKKDLPDDYCGPCFGAHEEEGQCCQTCDEVIEAYKKKRWKTDLVKFTAEQCIREGRDNEEPKKMTKGQGCNLSGYMTVNRVSGNFHIAMGEGVERDGRHIHTFLPDDAPNFNASHVIHHLSFGSPDHEVNLSSSGGRSATQPFQGVTKIVTEDTGTTGLFQYFIKVVPTTYVGKAISEASSSLSSKGSLDETARLETNRVFFTERFRPLMTDLLEEEHFEEGQPGKAAAQASHAGGHSNPDHHQVQNSVLPGVFFIYEIYPFYVEVSTSSVPFTHLLIRVMATIGGVITLVKWLDSCLYYERGSGSGGSKGLGGRH